MNLSLLVEFRPGGYRMTYVTKEAWRSYLRQYLEDSNDNFVDYFFGELAVLVQDEGHLYFNNLRFMKARHRYL